MQFKVVVLHSDGHELVRWETGENRTLVPTETELSVSLVESVAGLTWQPMKIVKPKEVFSRKPITKYMIECSTMTSKTSIHSESHRMGPV